MAIYKVITMCVLHWKAMNGSGRKDAPFLHYVFSNRIKQKRWKDQISKHLNCPFLNIKRLITEMCILLLKMHSFLLEKSCTITLHKWSMAPIFQWTTAKGTAKWSVNSMGCDWMTMLVTINKNLHKLVLAILCSQKWYVQLRNWIFCMCSDRIFDYSALFKTKPSGQILLIPKCSFTSKF